VRRVSSNAVVMVATSSGEKTLLPANIGRIGMHQPHSPKEFHTKSSPDLRGHLSRQAASAGSAYTLKPGGAAGRERPTMGTSPSSTFRSGSTQGASVAGCAWHGAARSCAFELMSAWAGG
jgi:hypothetical protein